VLGGWFSREQLSKNFLCDGPHQYTYKALENYEAKMKLQNTWNVMLNERTKEGSNE
jgi:hypothetical protein